jgi:hypothetical protein
MEDELELDIGKGTDKPKEAAGIEEIKLDLDEY